MTESSFNMDTPRGFRGLHPDLPITVYYRHLPHWGQAGSSDFVTFRLFDSIPQSKLQLLQRQRAEWERSHRDLRCHTDWESYSRQYQRQVEGWLDEGYGCCHFRHRKWVDELRNRLHHFHERRYSITCWAIMPNHCHLVIRPFDEYRLEDLIGGIKGVSARHINLAMGATGPLWQEEAYDRIIRHEEHLWRVIQYIGRNPRLAGLQHENAWRRWIDPRWEAVGWRFTNDA